MKLLITAKNFQLTEGIREAIESKLERFNKFIIQDDKVKVVLEVRKYGHKIEVMFPVRDGFVKAESIDEDLYVAVDLVTDKLKSQLSKYANKLVSKRHEIDKHFEALRVVTTEVKVEKRIVKRKSFNMKPMGEEEAVLQMEMLGHETFMFFNAETNTMCLIYKRNDGNYGIVESEY